MRFLDNIFCSNWMKVNADLSNKYAGALASLTITQNAILGLQNNISGLKSQISTLQESAMASSNENLKQIAQLQAQLTAAQANITALQDTLDGLIKLQNNRTSFYMLPNEEQTLLNLYYSKYPDADITYSGRSIPNQPDKMCDWFIQDWCQAGIGSPEAVNIVKNADAFVLDIMKEFNCTFHRACDISLMRCKAAVTPFYKYQTDQQTTNDGEFWKLFLETYYSMKLYGVGSDCDDWMTVCYVLWRTAGVPQQLLRNVAGTIADGEGHATNHYFASDLVWHHINSTSIFTVLNDVLKLPTINDTSDAMGVRAPWFSWNEDRSWTNQATINGTTAVDFFKPEKLEHVHRISLLRGVRIRKKLR